MDEKGFIKQIGHNNRRVRLKRGLSQLDLASACNIEKTSVGRIEKGNTNPTAKTLWKIAVVLEVKVADLVKVKKSPIPLF